MTLKGNLKFSLKKALIGGDMSKSTYTGPGELLLAPSSIGDINIIKLGGKETWSVGRDAFLACTQGIVTEYKSQGIGKAMFSGEGLFVYKISGMGVLWCTSFGAIIRKDVCPFPFLLLLFLLLHLPLNYPFLKNKPLTHSTARSKRKIHHRQRPPRRLELQIRPRARRFGRYHQQHDSGRGAGVQVHGAGDRVYADSERSGFWAVVGC
jgi:hypothetical protein